MKEQRRGMWQREEPERANSGRERERET